MSKEDLAVLVVLSAFCIKVFATFSNYDIEIDYALTALSWWMMYFSLGHLWRASSEKNEQLKRRIKYLEVRMRLKKEN